MRGIVVVSLVALVIAIAIINDKNTADSNHNANGLTFTCLFTRDDLS